MYTHPRRFCSEDNITFNNGKAETFLISGVSLLPESSGVIFADRLFFEKRNMEENNSCKDNENFWI